MRFSDHTRPSDATVLLCLQRVGTCGRLGAAPESPERRCSRGAPGEAPPPLARCCCCAPSQSRLAAVLSAVAPFACLRCHSISDQSARKCNVSGQIGDHAVACLLLQLVADCLQNPLKSSLGRELLKLGYRVEEVQEAGLLWYAVHPRQDPFDWMCQSWLARDQRLSRSELQKPAGLLCWKPEMITGNPN